MGRERLYIIHGMGNDAVGLVGTITAPIAQAGGNIVDLRQDVLHGLFTLFMVVDLSACELRIDELKTMVRKLSEDTGLDLSVDKYLPIARNPRKCAVLMICVGTDKAGIISSISKMLGMYEINIESAQTVAREGIFLMELLTDISRSALPFENVKGTLERAMAAMGITTTFQEDDVFNKKKRMILFDIQSSFIGRRQYEELVNQSGLRSRDIAGIYPAGDVPGCLRAAASLLDGFPYEVFAEITATITPTPGTVELLQTLKTMGYKIVLVTNGFSLFTDIIRYKLGIDYARGVNLAVDNDSKTVTGELDSSDGGVTPDMERILADILEREAIAREDVTVINDRNMQETPGIRLEFGLDTILDFLNKRIISKEHLTGILGSFGTVTVTNQQ